jgi:hypothetical protein
MRALGIVAAAIVGAVAGLAVGYAMFGRGERLYFGLLFGGAGGMIGGMTVAHLLPRGRFLR